MASENRRVAKNTLVLYFRMAITLVVSLFTSRVVLQALGVEDFGIYNVVGGIVASLSFLQQTLVMCFQRYFCKYIPHKDYAKLSSILGAATYIVFVICLVVFIFVESIGIWFLNHKLLIPADRLDAANVVLQLSILTFICTIFRAVYNAVIISFERMTMFAYISIFEVIAKLLVAYTVACARYDHLKFYALLIFIVSALTTLVYFSYVRLTYTNIRHDWSVISDRAIFKELSSFMGYSTIGTMSNVLKTTCVNFILNMFYGPVVNAARSISFQVYTAVSSFTHSFQTAFSPNMMKRCETESSTEIEKVLYITSKYSFYAMLFLSLPILIYTQTILELWLGDDHVPEYAAFFSRVMLMIGMVETISTPVVNIIYAKGQIRGFMTIISMILLLIIPLSYIALNMGCKPNVVYIIDILMTIVAQIARVFYLNRIWHFSYMSYFTNLAAPLLVVSVSCSLFGIALSQLPSTLLYLAIGCALSEICLVLTVVILGMKQSERLFLIEKIKEYKLRH